MDGLLDIVFSGWGLLLAGLVFCWKQLKRGLRLACFWLCDKLPWAGAAWLLFVALRALGKTLKIAKTPEQRAYAVASCYAILLEKVAALGKEPDTPKGFTRTLQEIVRTSRPVLDDYVDSVRFKSAHVSTTG